MLTRLTIRNYALIKDLKMAPSGDLNIITGETGAGKSILLGAMGLLLGNRADTKVLLNNTEKCIIEGEFEISGYDLKKVFDESNLDYEDLTLFRREISTSGKSRAFINDTPTTIETLREIGNHLVDIHSQHDTLLLGDSSFQLDVVDAFARNKPTLKGYRETFSEYSLIKKELESLKSKEAALLQERDFNQFQFDELDKVNLIEGEEEDLEKELELLSNAEDIKIKINSAIQGLSENDLSVLNVFSEVKAEINSISNISEELSGLSERLNSLFVELKELIRDIEDQDANIEVNPERTEEVQDRLGTLHNLKLKHRVSDVSELIELREKLSNELVHTANLTESILLKQEEHNRLENKLKSHASALKNSRTAVFEKLEGDILSVLSELGIPDGVLKIIIQNIDPTIHGTDKIQFAFSANKGIAPQEMKKVASGGEFSRLMFAIKYILASRQSMPTLIFDEIDTGISGEVALKMGKMMKEIGSNQQVIAITHLPQIAGLGNKHYFVF